MLLPYLAACTYVYLSEEVCQGQNGTGTVCQKDEHFALLFLLQCLILLPTIGEASGVHCSREDPVGMTSSIQWRIQDF